MNFFNAERSSMGRPTDQLTFGIILASSSEIMVGLVYIKSFSLFVNLLKAVKNSTDRPTDQPTDQPTFEIIEAPCRSSKIKIIKVFDSFDSLIN